MQREEIAIKQFIQRPYHLWELQWLLLTAGDFKSGRYNTMTVAWGSFGVMWTRPTATVVVRPTRYTYDFINQYNEFTLTAFPAEYRKALQMLGAQSGRDSDKIKASGLTPIACAGVSAPAFAEAELVVACRKLYWHDFDPAHFTDSTIDEKNYPEKDYHRMFIGEILSIEGVPSYRFL